MPDAQHLFLFVVAGVLLNLTPGPDVLYIVGNAIRRGAKAGVVAAVGVSAGCFVHIVAAAGGGERPDRGPSAMAFNLLKWRAPSDPAVGRGAPAVRPGTERGGGPALARGHAAVGVGWLRCSRRLLTNVLNPKGGDLLPAFVPQFIAPGTDTRRWPFVLLGTLFSTTTASP
jgi:threonine/homoserine/homoserine lactone efflux protein